MAKLSPVRHVALALGLCGLLLGAVMVKHEHTQKAKASHAKVEKKAPAAVPAAKPKVVVHPKHASKPSLCSQIGAALKAHGKDWVLARAKARGWTDAQVKVAMQRCHLG